MESHRRRGPFFTDRGQRKDLCFRATGRRRSTALPPRDHWKRELEIEPTNRLHNEPGRSGPWQGTKVHTRNQQWKRLYPWHQWCSLLSRCPHRKAEVATRVFETVPKHLTALWDGHVSGCRQR